MARGRSFTSVSDQGKKKTPFLLRSPSGVECSLRRLMAAEVSSFGRLTRAYKEDGGGGEGKRGELITRDLLGGGAVLGSPEVDLELQVPAGWERRLDLLSGKTYLQKRESNQHLHDLNLPPPPPAAASVKTTALFPEFSSALDLRLVSAATAPPPPSSSSAAYAASEYQSVCTLEKVKSALERAERESRLGAAPPHPPSPSSSTTSSSVKRRSPPIPAAVINVDEDGAATTDASESSQGPAPTPAMMVVAGCPACLLYVFVTKAEPTCPKCGAHVPLSEARRPRHGKKPRIDLNFSMVDE